MMDRATVFNVRVLEVDEPELPASPPVDVTVAGGYIESITPTAGDTPEGIDGQGRWVLPGLVNAHNHLYSKELRNPTPGNDLKTMRQLIDRRDEAVTLAVMMRNAWHEMAQGILVIRDLGARHGLNTRLAEIFAQQTLYGPVVIAAGRPIVMTGGHVSTFGREADGPAECRKAVREQRKAGAEVIKIMVSGGLSGFPEEDYTVLEYTTEELTAITDEARKLGLPTCAHAFGADAVRAAVGAGVDSIEHGVHLSDEVIGLMVANGTSYVPTMANMARIASPSMNREPRAIARMELFTNEIVSPQIDSVRKAIKAGIKIGIGTDSTGTYLEEITALQNAGLSTQQIIRSATSVGAAICNTNAGLIAPGKRALFNLYETDPRLDVTTLVDPGASFVHDRLFTRDKITALLN